MSCSNCNKSNCSCSDNCPNKASDITVFDCDVFNVIEIPCDASLCDALGLLESYTTNMVSELSTMTSVVITEPNCIDLVAGTYSIQQVIDAMLVSLCDLATCSPSVSISETGPFALLATPAGGVGPYTYQWSIADNLGAMSISGVSTNANVALSFGESPFTFGLAEVTITDSLGCVASNTFLYGVVSELRPKI